MCLAGFSARQRKDEVERLNEQLRKINLSLRQQAKAGTIYAPGLNYAPPPTFKKSEGGTYAVIEPQQAQPAQKVMRLSFPEDTILQLDVQLSVQILPAVRKCKER